MVRKIKLKELALMAVKFDCREHPDLKVCVGYEVYTQREILQGLEGNDKKLKKKFYNLFVKPLEKELKKNKEMRALILQKLGLT